VARIDEIHGALEARGCRTRDRKTWTCPAHDDTRASLSVTEGADGRVLLKCHAGCSIEQILAVLGKTTADLFPTKREARIVATYDYTDETGALLYQVVRFDPKDFRQRRPDGKGGWSWKLGDTRRVPYRLRELRAAIDAGDAVYIVEGEKDADAIHLAGCVATCNSGGAGKWTDAHAEALRGATDVRIVSDTDAPGRKHAEAVRASIARVLGVIARILEPTSGKDAYDHLAAGLGLEDLRPLQAETPPARNGHDPEASEPLAVAFPEDAFVGTFALVRDALRENTGASAAHVFAATWGALSVAIGRRVWGHWNGPVIPQPYLLSLGPVNDFKTSAARGALEILDQPRCSPASAAGLFDELVGRQALLYYADEWAELRSRIEYSGGPELRTMLNDLWGGPPYLTRNRSRAGKDAQKVGNRVDFPRMAILANGHVEGFWQKNAGSDLATGFLSRFAIFIGDGGAFLRVTRPVPAEVKAEGARILRGFSLMSDGPMELAPSAEDLWGDYVEAEYRRVGALEDQRSLLHRRIVAHVARLALTYAVDGGRGDVGPDHVERAQLVGEYLTRCADRLFDGMEPTPRDWEARTSYLEDTVIRLSERNPGASVEQIRNLWPNRRTRPPRSVIAKLLSEARGGVRGTHADA
jgi:hypothetical protein